MDTSVCWISLSANVSTVYAVCLKAERCQKLEYSWEGGRGGGRGSGNLDIIIVVIDFCLSCLSKTTLLGNHMLCQWTNTETVDFLVPQPTLVHKCWATSQLTWNPADRPQLCLAGGKLSITHYAPHCGRPHSANRLAPTAFHISLRPLLSRTDEHLIAETIVSHNLVASRSQRVPAAGRTGHAFCRQNMAGGIWELAINSSSPHPCN